MSGRVLAVGTVAAVAIGLAAFGADGLVRVVRLKEEVRHLERELTALRAHSDRLAQTIECLRHDPLCIEKFAREDLGLARQGETILKFPSERTR